MACLLHCPCVMPMPCTTICDTHSLLLVTSVLQTPLLIALLRIEHFLHCVLLLPIRPHLVCAQCVYHREFQQAELIADVDFSISIRMISIACLHRPSVCCHATCIAVPRTTDQVERAARSNMPNTCAPQSVTLYRAHGLRLRWHTIVVPQSDQTDSGGFMSPTALNAAHAFCCATVRYLHTSQPCGV